MKVRIQGNSIRYRLKEPEVARFRQAGFITETTQLGIGADAQLRFTLQVAECASPRVRHSASHIVVEVPAPVAEQWTGSEDVGFEALVAVDDNAELKLLVEKDFACLDRSDEEEAGSYPNPGQLC